MPKTANTFAESCSRGLAVLVKLDGRRQRDIAQAAQVSEGKLSGYLTGKAAPTLESLSRVLEALGADLSDLQDAMDVGRRSRLRRRVADLERQLLELVERRSEIEAGAGDEVREPPAGYFVPDGRFRRSSSAARASN